VLACLAAMSFGSFLAEGAAAASPTEAPSEKCR